MKDRDGRGEGRNAISPLNRMVHRLVRMQVGYDKGKETTQDRTRGEGEGGAKGKEGEWNEMRGPRTLREGARHESLRAPPWLVFNFPCGREFHVFAASRRGHFECTYFMSYHPVELREVLNIGLISRTFNPVPWCYTNQPGGKGKAHIC